MVANVFVNYFQLITKDLDLFERPDKFQSRPSIFNQNFSINLINMVAHECQPWFKNKPESELRNKTQSQFQNKKESHFQNKLKSQF